MVNSKYSGDLRNDRALLEGLINKYGKNDVINFVMSESREGMIYSDKTEDGKTFSRCYNKGFRYNGKEFEVEGNLFMFNGGMTDRYNLVNFTFTIDETTRDHMYHSYKKDGFNFTKLTGITFFHSKSNGYERRGHVTIMDKFSEFCDTLNMCGGEGFYVFCENHGNDIVVYFCKGDPGDDIDYLRKFGIVCKGIGASARMA